MDSTEMEEAVESYIKYVFMVASLVCIAFAAYFGINDQKIPMSAFLIASGGLLFFAFLPYISKGKVGTHGLEIETREMLSNAKTTLNELKILASQVAIVTLSLVKRSGRIAGFTLQEEEQIKENTIKILGEIGLEKDEIKKTLIGWHQVIESDYAHQISSNYIKLRENSAEGRKRIEQLTRYNHYSKRPSPEELDKFIEDFGSVTDEGKEWLEDYHYYVNNGEHRRPEVWARVFK